MARGSVSRPWPVSPESAQASPRIPDPAPRSRNRLPGRTLPSARASERSSRQRAVVAWWPVPNAVPGSMTTGTTWASCSGVNQGGHHQESPGLDRGEKVTPGQGPVLIRHLAAADLGLGPARGDGRSGFVGKRAFRQVDAEDEAAGIVQFFPSVRGLFKEKGGHGLHRMGGSPDIQSGERRTAHWDCRVKGLRRRRGGRQPSGFCSRPAAACKGVSGRGCA